MAELRNGVVCPTGKRPMQQRRFKYLRLVLDVMYEEASLTTESVEPQDLLVTLHRGVKPVEGAADRVRIARQQRTDNAGGWQIGVSGISIGTVFLFHNNGVVLELAATSNGWFRIRDLAGTECVVYTGTTGTKLSKCPQPMNASAADTVRKPLTSDARTFPAGSAWFFNGMSVGNRHSKMTMNLTPDGNVIVNGANAAVP